MPRVLMGSQPVGPGVVLRRPPAGSLGDSVTLCHAAGGASCPVSQDGVELDGHVG